MMVFRWITCTLVLAVTASAAFAQPEATLHGCQRTAGSELLKYTQQYVKAVSSCADAMSKAVIAEQSAVPPGSPEDAAATCMKALLKLENSADPLKTIAGRMAAKINAACDPAVDPDKVLHAEEDIIGTGMLAEQIEAMNLDSWCSNFGSDGAIDDLDEWVSCLTAAGTCGAQQAVATRVPRLLEWLDAVRPGILALDETCGTTCASCTDTAVADACNALDAIETAIDGAVDDGRPGLLCGPGGVMPGVDPILPETGQTLCASGGSMVACPGVPANVQDGDTRAGAARSYSFDTTVAGERTLLDNVTGLEWEILCTGGSCPASHSIDTTYNWTDAFTKVANMNAANYAGHNDWRLPNRFEVDSLVNLGRTTPATDVSVLETGCSSACTVDTCSCTGSVNNYWSSTSYAGNPSSAWLVDFAPGLTWHTGKSFTARVRAVRGQ
ncbi:MAG TPA: DUF1566 domain-containing protein [Candidatus Limnocylindrales bacterium]|nr:DUF1566 domain-containing protein [Candidatus Limnocylindrales bacterium]